MTEKTDGKTDAAPNFGAKDWVEIYQIIAEYNDYLGTGKAEAYGNLYTVDGTFMGEGEGRKPVVGRKNLIEFIKQRWTKPEVRKRTHWASNVVIRPTAEGAEAESYQMMVDKVADGYRIGGIHKKIDVLRRENGKWRFHVRRSAPLNAE
jgi:hypothetical protein